MSHVVFLALGELGRDHHAQCDSRDRGVDARQVHEVPGEEAEQPEDPPANDAVFDEKAENGDRCDRCP